MLTFQKEFLSSSFRDLFLNKKSCFAFFFVQWARPQMNYAWLSWQSFLNPMSKLQSILGSSFLLQPKLQDEHIIELSPKGGTLSRAPSKAVMGERANALWLGKMILILSYGSNTSNGGSNHKNSCGNHLIVTDDGPAWCEIVQGKQS